jgi:hypothetical protein
MTVTLTDCNSSDSRSTSRRKPAPVALVSAMDGESLATEILVLQLQMQTVQRGNGGLSLYGAAPSV